ncbi:MAG: NfeD family protein, partial [Betaproteobacteria bacterium]|nr:NfeD family protein [Betaproteobacteria bacterium]
MAQTTIWWVMAGALIALELLSGTFYLLMLSLGLVAAALAAH